jgi:exopolysaccharide biosynthesis polyprenyl glycosylphosphotransferase
MMFSRPVRLTTAVTDFLVMLLAFALAYIIRYEWQWFQPAFIIHPYESYLPQQALYLGLLLFFFWSQKVWQRRRGEFWVDEVARLMYAVVLATAVMVAYIFIFQPVPFSRLFWVWVPLTTITLLAFARFLRRALLLALYRRGKLVDQALVIGAGEPGRGMIRTLLARPDLGYQTIGYLQQQGESESLGSGRIPRLGTTSDLPHVLSQYPHLHTVFIALPAHEHQQVMSLIRYCLEQKVTPQVVPDLFQLSLNHVESNSMGGIPILSVRDVQISRSGQLLKRLIDLGLVLIAAVPTLLLGIIIALAIKLDSPGPIFYAAERVGQHERPFRMIKFRSMVVNADSQKEALQQQNEAEGPIFKIRNDPRLTRVGRVIRRLSLDEVPQLLNVLRGEMSLVGPRPPLAEEVAEYQPWHRQRLMVRGGITGLWQVSGRSDLTFDEQCLLDIYYIENWSLGLDLRIILQTIPYALFGRGAY